MALEHEAERLQLVEVAPDAAARPCPARRAGRTAPASRSRSSRGCSGLEHGRADPRCASVRRARSGGRRSGSRGPSKSRPMSSAGAEWVSAPTLIRSTPVRARAPTVSRVAAGGLEQDPRGRGVAPADRLGQGLGAEVVDQDDVGTARERPVELVERIDLDLDERRPAGHGPAPPRRPRRSGRRPVGEPGEVVVLDQDGVVQPDAVVPARRRTGRRTSPGPASPAWSCGCRGSRPASRRPAATNRAVRVAIPLSRWRKFSAVRSSVRSDRSRAGDLARSRSPASSRSPSSRTAASREVSSNRSTSRRDDRQPASTPCGPGHEPGRRLAPGWGSWRSR